MEKIVRNRIFQVGIQEEVHSQWTLQLLLLSSAFCESTKTMKFDFFHSDWSIDEKLKKKVKVHFEPI